MIEKGEFCFLNVNYQGSGHVPWSSKEFDRLWLYHLNYFDFLNIDLRSSRVRLHLTEVLRLALDWCEQNVTGEEIGWEPYPLSMRIVNWLKFLVRNGQSCESISDGRTVSALLGSLRTQTLALEVRLETDLLANHLLKNIKALLFAGALLESPESSRWWRRGEMLLKQELREQILPDGGHFERSPMYHVQVLEDLLDLQTLAATCGWTLCCEPELLDRIARMTGFLRTILHPDREIPLFNDSALGSARPAEEILSRTTGLLTDSPDPREQPAVAPETGYAVIRDPGAGGCLIFDCGPLGPDDQPGHGHCDVLSYELSLHGQRVVVDTGVSTYKRTAGRHYERSTAAHNTIRVDGEDQGEIWASFRLGRRPKVGAIETGAIAGSRFVRAEHFGYQRRGVVHHRVIYQIPKHAWLIVDFLRGGGWHKIESFIHFHPDVIIVPRANEVLSGGDGGSERHWFVRFGSHAYSLIALGEGELKLKESWYSPEFGLRQRRVTIHWTLEGPVPALMIYAFVPADGEHLVLRRLDGMKSIQFGQFTLPLE